MKKLISTAFAILFAFLSQSQELNAESIDSLAQRHNLCKTILLFTEMHDTTDYKSGQIYSQRISYYFDRVHTQLRDIDIYNFNVKIKPGTIQRAFRRKKNIPPATHIIYTFFNCSLVKVKLVPAATHCSECSGEYYFNDNALISKKEKNINESKLSFAAEANFYLTKLEKEKGIFVGCDR
jgi:hypothetical protein